MSSTVPAPQFLLHGIDTLQVAYYLRPDARGGKIDFEALRVERERLRQAKEREPAAILLGSEEFLLAPRGSGSGYPFVISNEDFRIEFGQNNLPSFFVTYRSQGLWQASASLLHQRFMDWAASISFHPFQVESISRADFAFDYHLPQVDFDEDSFVSLSAKDSQHREDGKVQTFSFGKGDIVLRVYDKVAEIQQQSGKVWFFILWERDSDVWRVEWQVRKPKLRRFGIETIADLVDQQGDLLRYLANEHDTLRIRTGDSNRSRWPLHPFWADLQQRIAAIDGQGVYRTIARPAALNERRNRTALAVYGYLKQLAAVEAVRQGQDLLPYKDAKQELSHLLDQLHDPLTWKVGVSKRSKAIALGEW